MRITPFQAQIRTMKTEKSVSFGLRGIEVPASQGCCRITVDPACSFLKIYFSSSNPRRFVGTNIYGVTQQMLNCAARRDVVATNRAISNRTVRLAWLWPVPGNSWEFAFCDEPCATCARTCPLVGDNTLESCLDVTDVRTNINRCFKAPYKLVPFLLPVRFQRSTEIPLRGRGLCMS